MILLTGTGNQSNTSVGFSVPAKGNFIVGICFKATSTIPAGERLALNLQIPGTATKGQTITSTVEVSDAFLAPLDVANDIRYDVSASVGAVGVSWQAELRITQGNDVA